MSEGTSSKRLPRTLEPRKHAQFGSLYNGVLFAQDLPRLADVTHSMGELFAELAFSVDASGERVVNVNVTGSVSVICQRCMQPMDIDVHVDSVVAVVRNEEEAKLLPERFEPWLVEDVEGDVYDLIEEELLLNMPVVSYHEHDCIDPSLLQAGEIEHEQGEAEGDNPFLALASLKEKLPKE